MSELESCLGLASTEPPGDGEAPGDPGGGEPPGEGLGEGLSAEGDGVGVAEAVGLTEGLGVAVGVGVGVGFGVITDSTRKYPAGAGSKAKPCSHRPRDPFPPQAVVRIPDKLKHLQSESGRPYRRACNQLGLCIYHTGRPYRRIISQELGQKAMQHCKIAHICTLDSPDFMVWRGIGAPGVIPCESTLDDSLPQNRVYW